MKTKYLFLTLLADDGAFDPGRSRRNNSDLRADRFGRHDHRDQQRRRGRPPSPRTGAGVGVTITQIDAGISVPVNTTFVLSAT